MTVAEPRAGTPAPLQLPADLRLTPKQFAQLCAANPEAVLELSADGPRSVAALRRKMARYQANEGTLAADWTATLKPRQ